LFPKIFSAGDFFLPTYGLLVAGGFLAALWLAGRLARRAGLPGDAVTSLGINSALVGLVGAKLLMLVQDFDYYRANPSEIFSMATLQAGGIFFGGLILALLFAFWDIRRKKLPLLLTLDVFAPALALGHAIGRLGCFAAGCCWGIACDRAWAVTFTNPDAHRLVGVPLGIPLHPTQLYEAAAQFAIFGLTYRWWGRVHRPGQVMAVYLMLAGAARFGIDFLRAHDEALPGGGPLSTAQWISVALALAGVWLWVRTSQIKRSPETA
jgi:phosphatidylglycerol---prolipoprotein diacylglyceryl transferase